MFNRIILFVVVVLLQYSIASASVLSPQIRCVSVQNGDVILTWSTPADPGNEFNRYLIYTSPSLSGPYSLLPAISVYLQTSYTHVGANANVAPVYYYIQTQFSSGSLIVSQPLDTVSSIHLNVVNPGNGTALLSWNAIATPNISSSTGIYTVYQNYPSTVWTAIATTTNLNYVDSILICNATLNYRIEISDTTGCISVSSVAGGTFQNIIVPTIPVIDTLSVDDNNHSIMNWNANSSIDVEAYVIYKFNGSAWIPIDTVYGINNTDYNYLLSNAYLGSEVFRLAAYDSCGNISPMGAVFKTMFLSSSASICDRSVTLSWTASNPIGTSLAGYQIYQSTIGVTGPYTLQGTVPPGTLTFTITALNPNTTYYYKIKAINSSGTKSASSNRIIFYSATPIPPQFSYLRKASVVTPNKIDITCHIDVAASVLGYKIYRSTDNVSSHFAYIGTVPTSITSPIVYHDTKVLPDKNSYYYKMVVVDSCGFDGFETNIGHTILLNAISNSDMTNTLTWNDYSTWLGGVNSYNIYRGIDGAIDPTPIANVAGGNTTFVDDISMFLRGEGVFNYYVEALEGSGNLYSFSDNSLSNVAEAYQDPEVFIPNTFKPSGINNLFIPITTYVNFTEYEFMVYNRWGLKVFSTNNVDEGWNGNKCEGGVYIYIVRYKSSKGEYVERKGSVTLLR